MLKYHGLLDHLLIGALGKQRAQQLGQVLEAELLVAVEVVHAERKLEPARSGDAAGERRADVGRAAGPVSAASVFTWSLLTRWAQTARALAQNRGS